MTTRQRLLQFFYPAWMLIAGWFTKNEKSRINHSGKEPLQSFYKLKTVLSNGAEFRFEQLKGKKILLVNTASDCGYTAQYEELEKLYGQNTNKLLVIAFPANDFKQQEQEDDKTIAAFCKTQFNISFPLAKKTVVVKSADQNEVYQWLTDSNKNGWNDKAPSWNFSKYLVNEQGILTHYFEPAVSPLSIPL